MAKNGLGTTDGSASVLKNFHPVPATTLPVFRYLRLHIDLSPRHEHNSRVSSWPIEQSVKHTELASLIDKGSGRDKMALCVRSR